jgi:hypothetical protein
MAITRTDCERADAERPNGGQEMALRFRGRVERRRVDRQETTAAKSQPASTLLDLRSSDGEQQRVQVEACIASNNQVSLQHLCEHGLGIARLVQAEVQPELERGALVRVLPEW